MEEAMCHQVREGEEATLVAAVRYRAGQAARGILRNLGSVLGALKTGSIQVGLCLSVHTSCSMPLCGQSSVLGAAYWQSSDASERSQWAYCPFS